MDNIFRKHREYSMVYVDDILVFSKTKEQHWNHLKIIAKEFIDHGLVLSEKKIEWEKNSIKFLGLVIDDNKKLCFKIISLKKFQSFLKR